MATLERDGNKGHAVRESVQRSEPSEVQPGDIRSLLTAMFVWGYCVGLRERFEGGCSEIVAHLEILRFQTVEFVKMSLEGSDLKSEIIGILDKEGGLNGIKILQSHLEKDVHLTEG